MAQAKRRHARRKEQYSLILRVGDSAPLAKITSSGDKDYARWPGPAGDVLKEGPGLAGVGAVGKSDRSLRISQRHCASDDFTDGYGSLMNHALAFIILSLPCGQRER